MALPLGANLGVCAPAGVDTICSRCAKADQPSNLAQFDIPAYVASYMGLVMSAKSTRLTASSRLLQKTSALQL